MSKKVSIVEEYLQYDDKYSQMYGRENTIVIFEVGSFYEMYSLELSRLQKISEITNLILTKKDKSNPTIDISNPYLIGFPSISMSKYVNLLINNNYTIIVISQTTPPPNPQRGVTEILSPATYIDELTTLDNNYLMSIYIEEISHSIFACAASICDVSTGKLYIQQILSEKNDTSISLDDIATLIQSYKAREIILTTNNLVSYSKNKMMMYLEMTDKLCHYQTLQDVINVKGNKMIEKIAYQQEMLKTIYNSKNNLIEEFELENYTHGRIAMIILFNYIIAHNSNLLKNISIPQIINKQHNLQLINNALYQLNIFNNDEKNMSNMYYTGQTVRSLFDILNKTSTAMGRRYLKNQLINPLIDTCAINTRYNMIEHFINNDSCKVNDDLLKMIPDIERFIRKFSIGNLHPIDLFSCINGLKYAYDMVRKIDIKDASYLIKKNKLIQEMYNLLIEFDNTFNYDELQKFFINDITGSIFKTGLYPDIDHLHECKKISEQYIYIVCDSFNKLLNELIPKKKSKKILDATDDIEEDTLVKVEYNDRDKYHLLLTKRRAELLQNYFITENKTISVHDLILTKDLFTFNMNMKGNSCKIFIPTMQEKSQQIIEIDNKLRIVIKNNYIEWLTSTYDKYDILFKNIIDYVSYIDFINCGSKVACMNKYCKPVINDKYNGKSYFDSNDLRHPIVEKILIDSHYVPATIDLGTETKDGILLFGNNSTGKSTLQKAIAINVILAQIGYYVAAKTFVYNPYHSLITRIISNDNIFKGLSSFALEMSELKAILKRSSQNTLVIADELCSGTEHQSSLIIVMAMLEMLSKNRCSFITATHLHDICNFKRLQSLHNIKLYHLHIDYDEKNNVLKYDRQLREGSGESFYGVYIAKYMINDSEFLKIANDIKVEMFPNILVSDKVSKYNPSLFVSRCMICNYVPLKDTDRPLETHHIVFQKTASKYGYILDSHIHKNHKNNLCTLCTHCHDEVDRCNIIIYGYNTDGQLSYDTNETLKNKLNECEMIAKKLII
jgi:DNA mismatch repair protein MutS